jgi:hypothetical protein
MANMRSHFQQTGGINPSCRNIAKYIMGTHFAFNAVRLSDITKKPARRRKK